MNITTAFIYGKSAVMDGTKRFVTVEDEFGVSIFDTTDHVSVVSLDSPVTLGLTFTRQEQIYLMLEVLRELGEKGMLVKGRVRDVSPRGVFFLDGKIDFWINTAKPTMKGLAFDLTQRLPLVKVRRKPKAKLFGDMKGVLYVCHQ